MQTKKYTTKPSLRIVSILCVLTISCVQPGDVKDAGKETIAGACDRFMQAFQKENISEAMQILKKNSVISESTIDTLEVTIHEQLKDFIPGYGKSVSYEFVSEQTIKNTIVKRNYLLKFPRYYLRFAFILYNNGMQWKITNFRYNEDVDELLR
jgi:hypothetical protein